MRTPSPPSVTRAAPFRGINEKLWHQARLKALQEGKSMRSIIEDLLRKWLEE